MSSAKVTKIVGSPGSGKTTELLQCVQQEVKAGLEPDNLLIMTFTRAAQNDAFSRLLDVYPDPSNCQVSLSKRVKTIHGAALSACLSDHVLLLRSRQNINGPGQLLICRSNKSDADYYHWFFKKNFPAIRYKKNCDPIKQLRAGEDIAAPLGNRLMALHTYLRSSCIKNENYHITPFDIELRRKQILEILNQWKHFKLKNDLIEHHDYIQRAIEASCSPDGTHIFVDEFQDVSPLQFRLVENWRDHSASKQIFIAGDPHQSIYGFRGADPKIFTQLDADKTLKRQKSRRCPEEILNKAKEIIIPASNEDLSEVTASSSGGEYEHLRGVNPAALSVQIENLLKDFNRLFLLARTNRFTAKIAMGLRTEGVPYLDLKPNGNLRRWEEPTGQFLTVLRHFRRSEDLPSDPAKIFLDNSINCPARKSQKKLLENDKLPAFSDKYGSSVNYKEFKTWYPKSNTAYQLIEQLKIDDWETELLKGALRSEHSFSPESVRVGTLHASKGLEAPCVILFPDYSNAQLERYYKSVEDDERRLFYVGMTRASKALYIAHGFFDGKEFPPLATE